MFGDSKTGNTIARFIALIFLSFLVFGAALFLVMPPLSKWAWSSCPAAGSIACALSLFLIEYWWLLAFPMIFPITWVLHRILPGGRSGSAPGGMA
jgi:hypothetical protein